MEVYILRSTNVLLKCSCQIISEPDNRLYNSQGLFQRSWLSATMRSSKFLLQYPCKICSSLSVFRQVPAFAVRKGYIAATWGTAAPLMPTTLVIASIYVLRFHRLANRDLKYWQNPLMRVQWATRANNTPKLTSVTRLEQKYLSNSYYSASLLQNRPQWPKYKEGDDNQSKFDTKWITRVKSCGGALAY